jgi:hypothetical protein
VFSSTPVRKRALEKKMPFRNNAEEKLCDPLFKIVGAGKFWR